MPTALVDFLNGHIHIHPDITSFDCNYVIRDLIRWHQMGHKENNDLTKKLIL